MKKKKKKKLREKLRTKTEPGLLSSFLLQSFYFNDSKRGDSKQYFKIAVKNTFLADNLHH